MSIKRLLKVYNQKSFVPITPPAVWTSCNKRAERYVYRSLRQQQVFIRNPRKDSILLVTGHGEKNRETPHHPVI